MDHPQPAFDFLLSLPGDNVFGDWHAHAGREVEKGDDIRNYPDVWDFLRLPDALEGLERDDVVTIQTFEGKLNLNAVAIGIGLENVRYEPDPFPPLVYDHLDNAVVFVWPSDIIVGIPKGSGDASEAATGIEQLVTWVHDLGLTEEIQFDDAITTHHVSSVIS